ncbi:hypothetical protein KSP40_PGU005165 [Platanthera guangdongensis]|uniref:Uncharacterized protein n=1 Tax=Platanthera guangdongensis TaxID=2320717 RepID=A0ABR2M251_9ASPA
MHNKKGYMTTFYNSADINFTGVSWAYIKVLHLITLVSKVPLISLHLGLLFAGGVECFVFFSGCFVFFSAWRIGAGFILQYTALSKHADLNPRTHLLRVADSILVICVSCRSDIRRDRRSLVLPMAAALIFRTLLTASN